MCSFKRTENLIITEKTSPVTADMVAERVIETAPLVMYFIRQNARKDKSTSSSIPRIRVLAFLKNCPGSSLSRLSESLGVTNATASALVETLVQDGLVERRDDPSERRRIQLLLTRAGQKQLETARRLRVAEIAEVLADLLPDQLQQIQTGLSLLKQTFQQLNSHQGE